MVTQATTNSVVNALRLDTQGLHCRGEWTVNTLNAMQRLRKTLVLSGPINTIDGTEISQLDSAGAWLLNQLTQQFPQATLILSLQHQALFDLVKRHQEVKVPLKKPVKWPLLARFGLKVWQFFSEMHAYIAFIGELCHFSVLWILKPQRILWQVIWQTVQRTGFDALMIVGLLSFLIGIVLAYQMGGQLQSYGASIYIVNLLGVSVLREFGPLITAIIVAGRSGSAFAASLGTMHVNQEIDALQTLGVSPIERLAMGKILGLIIVLPLLVMWADCTAMLGGLIMAKCQLQINPSVYIQQFHASIGLKQYYLGLIKTPTFAFIIASIGCFQGFRVKGGADSVGTQTTRSVVQAIFLIIMADALFSIVMSAIHV